MAKEIRKLTAVQVQKAQSNLTDACGGKLRCYRANDGTVRRKWWVYRYTSISGRQRDLPMGPVDQSSLAAAGKSLTAMRDLVADAKALLRKGIDPIDHARQLREEAKRKETAKKAASKVEQLTLRRFGRAYNETLQGRFRNEKHEAQWLSSIEGPPEWTRSKAQQESRAKLDALLDRPIADIKPRELLDALTPLCKRTPETGRRVTQRICALFDAAVVDELRDDNPVIPIRTELGKRAGKRKGGHFGALHTDTAARIRREGRKSGALIVPHVPSVEEWERSATAYQAWLLSRCAGIGDADFMPPTAEEVEAAYRKSMPL